MRVVSIALGLCALVACTKSELHTSDTGAESEDGAAYDVDADSDADSDADTDFDFDIYADLDCDSTF